MAEPFFALLVALVEIIVRICVGVCQGAIVLMELTAAMLAMVLEFFFLMLTEGKSAASQKFHQRREAQREIRAARAKQKADRQTAAEDDSTAAAPNLLGATIVLGVMFVAVGIVAVVWRVRDNIRKERAIETRLEVASLVNTFAHQLGNEDPATHPQSGVLDERDAWNRPLELTVSKSLLGTKLVVRSRGHDGRSATLDDIKATHFVASSATEIGGELADRSLQAARDKIKQLLPDESDAPVASAKPEEPDGEPAEQDSKQSGLRNLGDRLKRLLPGKEDPEKPAEETEPVEE